MRRRLHAILALITLTALMLGGRSYLYCHMTKQATTACCCAKVADEALAESPDLELMARQELLGPPCCEERGADAVTAASAAKLERSSLAWTLLPPAAVMWVQPPVFDVPLQMRRSSMSWPRAPSVARASPPRRGKLRARLAVTLC